MALSLFNDDWPFGYGTSTPMSFSFYVPRGFREQSNAISKYLADEFRQMQVVL